MKSKTVARNAALLSGPYPDKHRSQGRFNLSTEVLGTKFPPQGRMPAWRRLAACSPGGCLAHRSQIAGPAPFENLSIWRT